MFQLMVVHKRTGVIRTHGITSVTLGLGALLATLIVALALVTLWRGVVRPSGDPVDARLERALARSEARLRELEMEKAVVARRLAETEARLFRIEAVGQQLSESLGLTPPEPGTAPGVGGADVIEPEDGAGALPPASEADAQAVSDQAAHTLPGRHAVPAADDELLPSLGALDARLAAHESEFALLARVLAFQQENATVRPAGRPIREGWLSSPYGRRRDPFTGKSAFHRGVDFSGPRGSEIISLAAGVVTFVGTRSGYGRTVEVQHGAGLKTRYAHNDSLLVARGDVVARGQPIARLGRTGRATAAHVHLEIIRDGKFIDPMPFVRSSAAAVN